jgi:hypothetical protein
MELAGIARGSNESNGELCTRLLMKDSGGVCSGIFPSYSISLVSGGMVQVVCACLVGANPGGMDVRNESVVGWSGRILQ